MTYEEKVRWLRRYQESLRREQELAEEVERLQSEATRITPLLSGMPGGAGDGQKLPRSVEQIMEAQLELEEQIYQCGIIRKNVVVTIDQVTRSRDNEILRRRYIIGQKWEEIAGIMNIDCRWLRRIHKSVLHKLEVLEKIDYNDI